MTLKRKDGTISVKRVTALFTVLGGIATVVIAMPIFIGYCKAAISPWTTLPDKIDSMQKDIYKIEAHLDLQQNYYTTNKPMAKE